MKILVLSDIHYPYTNKNRIRDIIKKEEPDVTVLLGDIIEKQGYDKDFFRFISRITRKNYYFLKGDEDKVNYGLPNLLLQDGKRKYFFYHGNKLQGMSDEKTGFFVKKMKNLNPKLPLFLFAFAARIRKPFFKGEIVLGHAHAMFRFNILRVSGAGTMTYLKNIYNDKGYLVIERGKIRFNKINLHN